MKIVCEVLVSGVLTLRALAASSNITAMATAIKTTPGVGKPILYFDTLPAGHPSIADWDLHPDWAGYGNVVTSDAVKNAAMLTAMLANPPTDALTW